MKKVFDFLKSFHFLKGLVISLSALIPVYTTYTFFNVSIGVAMSFGILLVATSDIPGLPSQRKTGMFMALILGIFNYILIQLAKDHVWLLYPVAAFCVFISSYVAIYGFRASLGSFSSLLGIAISYVHQPPEGELPLYACYIFLGGLWYFGFSKLIDLLTPPVLRYELLNNSISQTAGLLQKNAKYIRKPDRTRLRDEMTTVQLSLTELHEQLRNELLTKEEILGTGGGQRKELLITAELVDIFEMVVAQLPFQEHQGSAKKAYGEALQHISTYLEFSARRLLNLNNKDASTGDEEDRREQLRNACDTAINTFRSEVSISEYAEDLLYLRSIYDYAGEVDHKSDSIGRFISESGYPRNSRKIENKELLITRQQFDPGLLAEHFSLKSPIMRHALRLVIATLLGLLIGQLLEIPKTYWILLTIFVLMRPTYALTKQRSMQRITGTLAGAAVAFVFVYLTHDMVFLLSMTFIALSLTFTYMQQNYRTAAFYVTIAMILIYVVITPDTVEVIQHRLIDTFIGAGIAILCNNLILPNWEYLQIKTFLFNFIESEKKYIIKIHEHYREKSGKDTPYLLARKNAFLMMAQLNASFQRQLQEPRSRQLGIGILQELLGTSQAILSATATLGTYIHTHKTTEISVHFDTYIDHILYNLNRASDLAGSVTAETPAPKGDLDASRSALEVHYHALKSQLRRMEVKGDTSYKPQFTETMKEARVISEQLEWIFQLSRRLYRDLHSYLEETQP